ncbi:MAG: hypothetical protein JXC33_07420 [Deltaproteobacteria bacterium]|nr:hypothetical protein [Deltaproteobacteria bacterium]
MKTGDHMNKRLLLAKLFIVASVTVFFLLTSCTHGRFHIKQIAAPPPSAKLRVFVLPITTSYPKMGWKRDQEEFVRLSYEATSKFLRKTDIYEVIPIEDVEEAIGGQTIPGWKWKRHDWALVKAVGKALHADYAMIRERGFEKSLYSRMVLINLGSGKEFGAHMFVVRGIRGDFKQSVKSSYKQIFRIAKGDLLETAIRKGRVLPPDVKKQSIIQKPSLLPESEPKKTDHTVTITQPVSGKISHENEDTPSTVPQRENILKPPTTLPIEQASNGKNRMVVYDFESKDQFRVIGLILTEALREELLMLGKFTLIDRENIARALEEMALQQTGLVEESQAIRTGRWLAANESVTGKLGTLGNTMILQAKRTDIETMIILTVGSLKTNVGQEEKLLNSMQRLAQKLAVIQGAK